jgi:hypothetical protein
MGGATHIYTSLDSFGNAYRAYPALLVNLGMLFQL